MLKPQLSTLARLISIACALGLLGGCGSTGGGSGAAPASSGPMLNIIPSAATLVAADRTAAEEDARGIQTWLSRISKPYANQLGSGDGEGVVVGVVDSGIAPTHPMLDGQVVASYNAFDDGTDVEDLVGHGTHVSGILAGTRAGGAPFEGVAPGAKLAIAKVFNSQSSGIQTIAKGIDWAVNTQAVPILNLSLGANAPALEGSIQNAVTKGTLVVAALGNEGQTGAANWPAEFAKQSWANGQIIAVGSLNSANVRHSTSNMDASLANWTVYAPGSEILSSHANSVNPTYIYAFMTGTSMATPMVAGQAALIKSNWNFLSANSLAQIIFRSAKRMCSDGSSASTCSARTTADSVYGWGLIDVGASLQPVGALNISTRPLDTVGYAGTKLASAKSGLAADLAQTNVIAVDEFNRGFMVNLGATVASTSVTTNALPSSPATPPSTAQGFAATAAYASGVGAKEAGALGRYAFRLTAETGHTYTVGFGGASMAPSGLAAKGLTPLSLGGEGSKFGAPYLSLLDSAAQVGYGFPLGGDSAVHFSAMNQPAGNMSGAKTLATVEVSQSFGSLKTVTSVGLLQEEQSILGLAGQGALSLDGASATNFLSLSAAYPFGQHFNVSGMASLGRTEAFKNTARSLISGTSESLSAAWSVGVSRLNLFKEGDNLGLTLSMPMRTFTGTMSVDGAVGQNQLDGSLIYATQTIGLAPSGRQHDVELAYSRPLSRTANLSAMAQLKVQPGHVASAPNQYGVGLKYVKSF